MKLPLQNFATLIGNAAAAVQGAAGQLLDLSVGSVLRAVLEANASMALWLQWLIVLVLQTTRAATSVGSDLDSWVGDFSLMRLPAVQAAGRVQLARFVVSGSAVVPVGLPVRTADGSQTFVVVAEPANVAWQASVDGFVLAAGSGAVDVPVIAVATGVSGNVRAGTVTLVAASVPGIDTVVNAGAFGGGVDAESDLALRARFQLFLATRSRATNLAINGAVLSTRQGLTTSILENVSGNDTICMGSFIVTVDDGTGTPSADILAAAAVAIEAMRPVGTTFTVRPPTVTWAAISLTVTTTASGVHAAVAAAVTSALATFVNALPIGAVLPYSRLMQVAYDASPGVANVVGLRVNGDIQDILPGPGGVVKALAAQVS